MYCVNDPADVKIQSTEFSSIGQNQSFYFNFNVWHQLSLHTAMFAAVALWLLWRDNKENKSTKKRAGTQRRNKKKMAIVMWNVWRGGAFPNVSLSGNAFITSIVIYRGEFCHSESGCLRHWCLSLPTACSTLGDKNGFLSVYQAKAWVGSHFLSLLFFCGSQHILVTGQISLQDLCWLWAYCNCNQYNIFICCWIIYKRKFLFLIKLGCFGLLCKLE